MFSVSPGVKTKPSSVPQRPLAAPTATTWTIPAATAPAFFYPAIYSPTAAVEPNGTEEVRRGRARRSSVRGWGSATQR